MELGSSSNPSRISAVICYFLLMSSSSLAYPLAGENGAGKCQTIVLGECERVRLTSKHPLALQLPSASTTGREISVASCLLAETETQPAPRGLSTPRLESDWLIENFTFCVGSTEQELERSRPLQLWRWSPSEVSSSD